MQSTELLYLTDSYLREFDARVVGRDEHSVILDRTAFFPRGGGQMADRGWLEAEDHRYPVIAVEKREDAVYHTVEGDSLPGTGERVHGQIDWEFRYQMMRTHSALHVLCGVIYREFGASVTGCQMYPDRARMDFALADLDRERVHRIEQRSNEVIREGSPVRWRLVPRREANLIPDLIRTKVNLLPPQLDPVRTVEILGLDLQADGGTHVANTMEIGGIKIRRTENKGKENRRLEIELLPASQEETERV